MRTASLPSPAVLRPSAAAASSTAAAARSPGYIVAPLYDWLLFLLAPTFALVLGFLISRSALATAAIDFHGQDVTLPTLAIGIFTHAHLVIVFFRSHGNAGIFRQHPVRFLLVPPVLWIALGSSAWVFVSVSVLATFWDVYHSGAQTFGLARIYDRKHGNDPGLGRRLDWWLNHLLYAGPILAGATMMDHFGDFNEFRSVGATVFTAVPVLMEGYQRYVAWAVLLGGSAFLIYYLLGYWRLARQGYRVSPLKVFLLATTGFCSIYTWGFNSFGQAFFIMNFFHSLQYFGLVWTSEKQHMMKLFGLEEWRGGKALTLFLFIGLAFAYGYWVQRLTTTGDWLWNITLVVSLMHFWYDGFIWSVRKKQV